jgi:hypothetical protein
VSVLKTRALPARDSGNAPWRANPFFTISQVLSPTILILVVWFIVLKCQNQGTDNEWQWLAISRGSVRELQSFRDRQSKLSCHFLVALAVAAIGSNTAISTNSMGTPLIPCARTLETVTELIYGDECGKCLSGKAASLEAFVRYMATLGPSEKKACILTALAIFDTADEARPSRVRSRGQRVRYRYHVPLVGAVCNTAFQNCFEVSATTIARYKRQIRQHHQDCHQ